jgi:hypothetical protein
LIFYLGYDSNYAWIQLRIVAAPALSGVADPDLGSGAFLTPESEMGKNQDPDPGPG